MKNGNYNPLPLATCPGAVLAGTPGQGNRETLNRWSDASTDQTDKNPSHYKGAILRQEERTADLATDRPERIDQAIARLHAAKKDLDEVLGDDWTKMPDLYQVQRENNLNR